MRRTSRVGHPAPKRRESKTECGRGALPLMDWQKFPRLRCRPSRSLWRRTIQADDAVLTLSLSSRAERGISHLHAFAPSVTPSASQAQSLAGTSVAVALWATPYGWPKCECHASRREAATVDAL